MAQKARQGGSMTYETRITGLTIAPQKEPIFSECATNVRIVDEAAGEFVEVEQQSGTGLGKIQFTPEEWPHLRKAINRMVKECREMT
jgi:hypothetical protein